MESSVDDNCVGDGRGGAGLGFPETHRLGLKFCQSDGTTGSTGSSGVKSLLWWSEWIISGVDHVQGVLSIAVLRFTSDYWINVGCLMFKCCTFFCYICLHWLYSCRDKEWPVFLLLINMRMVVHLGSLASRQMGSLISTDGQWCKHK